MDKAYTIFLVIVLVALTCPVQLQVAHAQNVTQAASADHRSGASTAEACQDPSVPPALKEAMHLACSREHVLANQRIQKAIILGFVGGFVKRDDTNHPEVLFARYLQERYGDAVHVEVFGNHEAEKALNDTVQRIKVASAAPIPEQVRIILYGHSWGASQVLTFARELERRKIPVALTIQVDSVRKFGQEDHTVPANVAKAVNFYQSHGLTPGRPQIIPADATRTQILGNFQMKYENHQVDCGNYRWPSRVLNKGHHQIENDPQVWNRILSLIDTEVLVPRGQIQNLSSSESPALK